MEKKKLSIIIPVYNSEKYIKRCILSIMNQTYSNLEIIIINDGSTDNTLNIVKKLKEKDSRINIINKENTGVSDSRNKGIEMAQGDYIGFVDSDDYIEKNMYETIMNNMNDDIDGTLITYNELNNKKIKTIHFPIKEKICEFDKKQIRNFIIPLIIGKLKKEQDSIFGSVWRCLFKKEYIKKIKFNTKLIVGEDSLFLIDYLMLCRKVNLINEPLYNYIIYSNSTVGKFKKDYDENNKNYHKEIIKRLKKINFFDFHLKRYQINRFIMYTTSMTNSVKNKESSFFDKVKKIKEYALNIKNDNYLLKEKYFNELDFERKILYVLMQMRLYVIITMFFCLKVKVKVR